MNECHTHEQQCVSQSPHSWFACRANESHHTHERVMWHIWTRHVTHTYERVMSHIWTRHVIHTCQQCVSQQSTLFDTPAVPKRWQRLRSRELYFQMRPVNMSKETYKYDKWDLWIYQKRLLYMSKETHQYVTRELSTRQNRLMNIDHSKGDNVPLPVLSHIVKRVQYICQKNPIDMSKDSNGYVKNDQ